MKCSFNRKTVTRIFLRDGFSILCLSNKVSERNIRMAVLSASGNFRLLTHEDCFLRTPMEAGKTGCAVITNDGFSILDEDIIHGTDFFTNTAANAVFI
jgi:hypothetical protein